MQYQTQQKEPKMASKVTIPVNPSASDVRAFYNASPARLAKLSEKAALTITGRPGTVGVRGRLHPEVIADFNKGRKSDRQYVAQGNRAKAAQEQAKATRKALMDAGLAGAKGPLSKAAKEFLATQGQSKG
jgi:hypothetical protein